MWKLRRVHAAASPAALGVIGRAIATTPFPDPSEMKQ
jgi:hypothetical protein